MNEDEIRSRSEELFREKKTQIYERTDKWFASLILLEWVAAIFVAAVVSPWAWEGRTSYLHPHFLFAVIAGGVVALPAVYCVVNWPGGTVTRHVVAISQMLFSALFIHLTGGRIETHFHVFGSLALMSFYRDWRVLVTATVVVLVDHLVRGTLIPESVYGVLTASPWRSVEHAGWVLFEDVFLVKTCLQNQAEMKSDALKQAHIEATTNNITEIAENRAKELITVRVEGEMATRQLAAIVESSSDAIVSRTFDGEILSWNPGAEKMYGYSAEEAIGRNVSFIIPAECQKELNETMLLVESGASLGELETTRLKKDGTLVNVSITLSPIRDSEGSVVGCSVIARDITQRKEIEKRISEFYSTVSHELRTPLTSIRGALGLIDDDIIEHGSTESREMIRIARTSSERLVRLINDILDLKKIESGKLELIKEKITAEALLFKGIDAMEGMAKEARVEINHAVDPGIILEADADRITQVLTNLISNAVKYSDSGDLVMITAEVSEGNTVRFSITDEGPGIPVEHQGKLFGKFQQIDSSDTRPKEGTGLGLAISKAIVEQHGGAIGVHSRPGIGTSFWFELPCLPLSIDSASDALEADPEKQTVLVVEDDLNLAQFLKLRLTKEGYFVRHAASRGSAQMLLNTVRPDVILMDVTLPDGSGLELIQELRQKTELVDIPVIVMTGNDLDEYKCGTPVVFDWFFKPFEYTHLIKSVQRATNDIGEKTVLVIEDEPETRAVIVAQLKQIGAICVEAQDGIQAVSLAKSIRPDVIVLDVNIPQMNGFEVVESLNDPRYQGTPLVVYSAEDLNEMQRKKLTLGLTKHLTKGRVSPKDFVNAVSDLLDAVTKKSMLNKPASTCCESEVKESEAPRKDPSKAAARVSAPESKN